MLVTKERAAQTGYVIVEERFQTAEGGMLRCPGQYEVAFSVCVINNSPRWPEKVRDDASRLGWWEPAVQNPTLSSQYINQPQIIFEKQKGTFRWLFLIVLKSSKMQPDKERNPRMEVVGQLTPTYETAPNDQR